MSQNYVKKLIPLCPRATIEVCVITVNLLIHQNLHHHHWPSSLDLGPKCLHSDLALPMEYHPAAEMKNMHHKVTTLISLVHGELQGGLEATRNNTHFILFLVAFKRRKRKERKQSCNTKEEEKIRPCSGKNQKRNGEKRSIKNHATPRK